MVHVSLMSPAFFMERASRASPAQNFVKSSLLFSKYYHSKIAVTLFWLQLDVYI